MTRIKFIAAEVQLNPVAPDWQRFVVGENKVIGIRPEHADGGWLLRIKFEGGLETKFYNVPFLVEQQEKET
jgi:hypothetical protein